MKLYKEWRELAHTASKFESGSWKVMTLFRAPAERKWGKQSFVQLKAWVEECHIGGSHWCVHGEELFLPSFQRVDELPTIPTPQHHENLSSNIL